MTHVQYIITYIMNMMFLITEYAWPAYTHSCFRPASGSYTKQ